MNKRIKYYFNKLWDVIAEIEDEARCYIEVDNYTTFHPLIESYGEPMKQGTKLIQKIKNEDLFQLFFELKRLTSSLEDKYRNTK